MFGPKFSKHVSSYYFRVVFISFLHLYSFLPFSFSSVFFPLHSFPSPVSKPQAVGHGEIRTGNHSSSRFPPRLQWLDFGPRLRQIRLHVSDLAFGAPGIKQRARQVAALGNPCSVEPLEGRQGRGLQKLCRTHPGRPPPAHPSFLMTHLVLESQSSFRNCCFSKSNAPPRPLLRSIRKVLGNVLESIFD